MDEILKYDDLYKSYLAVLSCGTVYYAVQGKSNFWVCGWNIEATKQYFPVALLITLYKAVLTFDSVDEILKKSLI